MQMDAGLDTGDMLLTEPWAIGADDTTGSLHDRLAALGARLAAVEGATFLDQAALMARATAAYRQRTLELLLLGLLAVLLILLARYRRLAVTAAAMVPALLAAGAVLTAVLVREATDLVAHATELVALLPEGTLLAMGGPGMPTGAKAPPGAVFCERLEELYPRLLMLSLLL